MSISCSHHAAWAAAALALLSCRADEDVRVFPIIAQTDKAIIRADTSADFSVVRSFCAGDRLFVDRFIGDVEAMFSVEPGELADLTLVDTGTAHDYCDGASGCYKFSSRRVISSPRSAAHELVHLITYRFAQDPSAFLAEGVANGLTEPTRRGEATVSDSLDMRPYEPPSETSSHFVRWLLETYGAAGVRRLLEGESWEEVYGEDVFALESEFDETAPRFYEQLLKPVVPPRFRMSEAKWSTELWVDCSQEDTMGVFTTATYGNPARTLELEIPEAGTYEFFLDSQGGGILGIVAEPAYGFDPSPGGDFDHTIYVGMFYGVAGEVVVAGEPAVFALVPSRLRIFVEGYGYAPTVHRLTVRRIGS